MTMAAQVTQRKATYADLEAVPPHLVAEILHGRLVTHPRPAPRHAIAATRLSTILSSVFDLGMSGAGGWVFMIEPELHLGEEITVPDIAAWKRTNFSELPETAWIETPPDWVCEVISPSTERYNRTEKRQIYADAGVEHLWHVDTRTKLLEVFELSKGRWVLLKTWQEGSTKVRDRPFEATEFQIDLLWPFDTDGASSY